MAKRTARRTAAKELERRDLVVAVRTLVAMASCWLDRDPATRGVDSSQARRLRSVVDALAVAAADQQRQARRILAGLYRDEVAVALGNSMEAEPALGNYLKDRAKRYPNLPRQLLAEWVGTYPMFQSDSPVAQAIVAGYFNFTLLGYGVGEVLNQSRVGKYVADLEKMAEVKEIGMSQAASAIVVRILAKELVQASEEWSIGPARVRAKPPKAAKPDDDDIDAWIKESKTAEKRMNRALGAERHPDRLPMPDAVDLGTFFGARKSNVAGLDPRAAAALDLLAAASEMQLDLDGNLKQADYRWPGTWSTASRGLVDGNLQIVSPVCDPRPSDADDDPLGP
jgi:hypothetical protein